MPSYHLAQVNIALPLEPLDSARLADFVSALAPVNALADAAPGFVWRLQGYGGDATAVRAFGDDRILVNMSVWESAEALSDFVFRNPEHAAVMRRRREWFVPMKEAFAVLWWIPAGHIPTVAEAEERLDHLRRHGPTPRAFTFRRLFPAPDAPDAAVPAPADDSLRCPAG
ncbi:DUF3291 domain-containing protein [Sorangium sp. So ce341]|uniref:DUF3291 domain-containing protein n=1 Tax=Sorangium sp. So ce341 TaxID=3133302 RepID=UPI003F6420D9